MPTLTMSRHVVAERRTSPSSAVARNARSMSLLPESVTGGPPTAARFVYLLEIERTSKFVVHAGDWKVRPYIKVVGHDMFKHSTSESFPRRPRHGGPLF